MIMSVSIFGQTTGYRIYTVSRELIGLSEIHYPVFGIQYIYKIRIEGCCGKPHNELPVRRSQMDIQ